MVVALVLISVMALVELGLLWCLLNRLLLQAKIPPILMPAPVKKTEEQPELPQRRKIFTVPIRD